MWGHLAGRVAQSVKDNAGDLRSTMARIGEVVAPPASDEDEYDEDEEDDEDEDDDDDEFYEDEDDEEYDEEEEEEEEEYEYGEDKTAPGTPTRGLGALLSPFLDHNKQDQPTQYDDNNNDDDNKGNEEEEEEEVWESVNSPNENNDNVDKTSALAEIQPESMLLTMTPEKTSKPKLELSRNTNPNTPIETKSPLASPKDETPKKKLIIPQHLKPKPSPQLSKNQSTFSAHNKPSTSEKTQIPVDTVMESTPENQPQKDLPKAKDPSPTIVSQTKEQSLPPDESRQGMDTASTTPTAHNIKPPEEAPTEEKPRTPEPVPETTPTKQPLEKPSRQDSTPKDAPRLETGEGAQAEGAPEPPKVKPLKPYHYEHTTQEEEPVSRKPDVTQVPQDADSVQDPGKDVVVHEDAVMVVVPPSVDQKIKDDLEKMTRRCRELEHLLQQREQHMLELQKDAAGRMDAEEEWRQDQLLRFKQEQAQALEAMTESATMEHNLELSQREERFEKERQQLRKMLQEERASASQHQQQLQQLLSEARARIEATETDKKNALHKQGAMASQMQQRQERAVLMAEEKLAETMAQLDDKQEEIKALKKVAKELKGKINKKQKGEQEVQDELEHLRSENDTLHHNWQVTEEENEELKKQLEEMESKDPEIEQLKLEIKKLEDDRNREKAERESAVSSRATLEAERDRALAQARDVEHQLTASLADVQVARADTDRAMLANSNLNRALEAFQSEREAEVAMLEEQRLSQEESTAAAHAAALEATHEANESRMRQVKAAADRAIKKIQQEVTTLQDQLEESRRENTQSRRSLDEAIHRLQATQEDVVDRNLMKNILLDWFAKKPGKARKDVLEVMASLLHFTDAEKEKVDLFEDDLSFGKKVVGAVAAPLPPPAADVNRLEGSSVREKWVSFLLAETDESQEK